MPCPKIGVTVSTLSLKLLFHTIEARLGMTNYLLIHGSWHGAWCWHKVAPRLENEGHCVTAPDLPGRINMPGRPILIGLPTMIKSVVNILSTKEKTTLVVHSRYGVLASQLAENYPDRIERIIYLASYMLPNGKRAAEYFRRDKNSYLTSYVKICKSGMWDYLDPEIYKEGLYHDCNDDDNMLGKLLLGKEPLRPAIAKIQLSENRYGTIPKAYIRLTQDRAVSLSLQDRLINETPVDRVESIDASHSAYFSKPDELTQTILKLSMS